MHDKRRWRRLTRRSLVTGLRRSRFWSWMQEQSSVASKACLGGHKRIIQIGAESGYIVLGQTEGLEQLRRDQASSSRTVRQKPLRSTQAIRSARYTA